MENRFKVTAARLARFSTINEAMREMTAAAESQFFSRFEDLTVMQINVLRIINFHIPCTMGQIAKTTGLTLGSVTQIVDNLIRKKYVKRIRSTEDRRVVYAELATKGKTAVEAAQEYVDSVAKNVLSKFSEVDQEKFLEFFEKMTKK